MACFQYDASIDFNKISITKSEIENFLPRWKTRISEVYQYKTNNLTEINILVAASSETEIQQWIHDYEEISKCSYSIRSTEKCSGTKVRFRQRLKCKHNTRYHKDYDPTRPHKGTKNINCPSTISITLKTVKDKYRGRDKSKAPDPSMPCEIKMIPYHNHSPSGHDALRLRQVKNETNEETFVNHLESGDLPSNEFTTENITIIIEKSEEDDEQYISEGIETINDVSEIFSEYLTRSPKEISKALQVLFNGLKSIETDSEFATACHTFSAEL